MLAAENDGLLFKLSYPNREAFRSFKRFRLCFISRYICCRHHLAVVLPFRTLSLFTTGNIWS